MARCHSNLNKMSNLGFWEKLPRPFFCLAPMAQVTNIAFRTLIAKYGRPDVMWTEFVSADGLASVGKESLLIDLQYTEKERPIVAQLFSANLDKMYQSAKLIKKLGFDGLDLNMGCPDRTIEKQGTGAAHLKNPEQAREIIRSAKKGARGLPISVKTRLGYNKNEIETWIPTLLEEDIAVIIMHARTRKEMSNVPANWDLIKRTVEIVRASGKKTLVIGNGDVRNLADARKKAKETGCDGVMIGRAIFGNPTLFAEKELSIKERLEIMIEHTRLFEKLLGQVKNFAVMKKHFSAYVVGFKGAKKLRTKLMEAQNVQQVEEIVKSINKSL